jgi:hypothetical protein
VDAFDPNPCRPTGLGWRWYLAGARKQDSWEFDGRERLPQFTFPLQRVGIDHNRLRVDLLGERIGMFEEPK